MNYQELLKEYVMPIINKIRKPRPDDVLEIEMFSGFGGDNAHEILANLAELYVKAELNKDPQWHFFYEGKFTVLRFSRSFSDKVESTLRDMNLKGYVGPKEWVESTYVTKRFQYTYFVNMFHWISEGAIMLVFDENRSEDMDYFIKSMAERIIHAWFNHNLCSAVVFGKDVDSLEKCQTWEGLVLNRIAADRMYYAGRYEYARYLEKIAEEQKNGKQN
jgi:hypothetical protein